MDYLAEAFREEEPESIPERTPPDCNDCLREAEDAKRTLSTRDQTTITFEHGGDVVRVPLTRQTVRGNDG